MIVDVLIEARSRAAESKLSELTPRERELLAEIASGKSNGAIAESLVLTKRAVEKHVNSIFSKLEPARDRGRQPAGQGHAHLPLRRGDGRQPVRRGPRRVRPAS